MAHPLSLVSKIDSAYTPEDLLTLKERPIPQHIAIIMDGNRRWAKAQGLPPLAGHWEGAEVLDEIIHAAAEIGIQTVTVYSFSTENWKRSEEEVEMLMHLFEAYLLRKKESMIREGVCLNAIGNLSKLPFRVQEALAEVQKATSHCKKINLVLALNYGGRDEICRALRSIVQEVEEKKLSAESLTEETISSHLDTSRWGDPELVIRTSGELRVSNFLLWQISYAEIYVSDVLWPDFSPQTLFSAILSYQERQRRLGGSL